MLFFSHKCLNRLWGNLPWSAGLFKLRLVVFRVSTIQGTELVFGCKEGVLQIPLLLDVYKRFLSNLVWWQTLLVSVFWYQCQWPWSSLGVTGFWKSYNLCSYSVLMWHEDICNNYVREFCMYGERGSFEHLLFLFSKVSVIIMKFEIAWHNSFIKSLS